MVRKVILGLDIGWKRTGIAISDASATFSFPRESIETKNREDWYKQVKEIAKEEAVDEIVVGLPLNQDGEEGDDAKSIQGHIALLRERLKLPVIEWDERFTTLQAERTLLEADLSREKRKKVIDKIAASIILQSYLDSLHFKRVLPPEDDE